MSGGGEDSICGESLGDGVQTPARQKLGEDPLHHRRYCRVKLEPVELLAGGGFGGVGVGSGVGELVSVGWPSAEEAALDGSLGGHRGTNPGFDAVSFTLAHSPIQVHDDLVGVGARVDRTAHFGHPQAYPVVDKDGEGETELVAVEGALRFADHDGIEATVRIGESV
ncbi:hypothetical protein BMS3Bbin01_01694 [bacterium BMS3Bbin01]|nr:hypothetical protein BMS3Bbin01_01694 [bacterium BMS3Bbin01]